MVNVTPSPPSPIVALRASTKDTEHHVLGVWSSLTGGTAPASFRNPWSSFHKPGALEVLRHATFGDVLEEGVHVVKETDEEKSRDTVNVLKPTWGGPWNTLVECGARVTWLGHAGALVQLPPTDPSTSRSINIIFDPIFSNRSSPSKLAGPSRITPSPCSVADLPPIDLVLLSHNHYDHVDLTTLTEIYTSRKEAVHFIVPLSNKATLKSMGIPNAQITQMDWWNEADISLSTSLDDSEAHSIIRVICTPAQHNSGRWGLDSNTSLWSSWLIEDARSTAIQPFRTFFAGDTGLRYRDHNLSEDEWICCPAFSEIVTRIGPPDLAILPVSVGGTAQYIKSFDPVPRPYALIPNIPDAITSSTHMTPGDAVALHKILSSSSSKGEGKKMISIAMHFGTFCSGEAESRDTVRTLRRECERQDVPFLKRGGEEVLLGEDEREAFVVLDQGGTLEVSVLKP